MKKKKARRAFTPGEKKEIAVAAAAAPNVEAYAREHELNPGMVRRWIKEGRAAKPPEAIPTRRGRSGATDEQKAAAVAELEAGGKADEIAPRYGVTSSGLYLWRKKLKANGHDKATIVVAQPVLSNGAQAAHSVMELQRAARTAIGLLRRGKAELLDGIRAGRIDDIDPPALWSLLALNELQGE